MKKNEKINVVAIIQARMLSSRLPGKVMKEIAGFPMIYHVLKRVSSAKMVDEVVVATTVDRSDEPIADFCKTIGFKCFRGHSYDVLDRYYQAAHLYKADIIVRITSDCPLIDPEIIDSMVTKFQDSDYDFIANRLPPPWKRTYPIGLDVELVSFSALQRAWREAETKFEREHVMPYLYDKTGRFKILVIDHNQDNGEKRLTVDTPKDLELIKKIFDHFSPRIDFSWLEALELLKKFPELEKINSGVSAKMVSDVDKRFDNNEDQE